MSRAALQTAATHLAAPLLLVALIWAMVPFGDVFAFDPDEGNNLMKARLVADGHRLYSEVWSDQPPLFTHVLRAWMGVTGWTVQGARILVLLCSGVLVWAFYQSVRLTAGHVGAIASSLLLVTSFGYTRLSVSVMLAIPSLMFAMLSVYGMVRYHLSGQRGWLAMSGVCLALSVFIKMWTLILVAVLMPAVRDRGKTLLWWIVPFASVVLLLLLAMVPLTEFGQLVRPHMLVRGAADFTAHTRAFWGRFIEDIAVVLPALVGVVVVVRRRLWTGAVPVAWAVLAVLVLARHEPLWYHHYLLVSIPMCWCAGFVALELTRRCSRPVALVAAVTAGLFLWHLPDVYRRDVVAWTDRDSAPDREVVKIMRRHADRTRYVMTDRQIFAFRAGLRVPPPLAVTSLKRRWAGQLADGEPTEMFETWRPEQVFLSGRRLPVTPTLIEYLEPRYRFIYQDPRGGGLLVSEAVGLNAGNPATADAGSPPVH